MGFWEFNEIYEFFFWGRKKYLFDYIYYFKGGENLWRFLSVDFELVVLGFFGNLLEMFYI